MKTKKKLRIGRILLVLLCICVVVTLAVGFAGNLLGGNTEDIYPQLDISERSCSFVGDKEINLTAKEFDLLELLITNPNKVYKRDKLLNLVWGFDYPGDVRTVDVHVRRLREKIEKNPSDPRYIHTKWGVGYYFQKG